jgi:ERCC4-type nuclease
LSKATTFQDQSVEVLTSVRRVTKEDAERLLQTFGGLQEVVLTNDSSKFTYIDKIAGANIDSLNACMPACLLIRRVRPRVRLSVAI